MKYIFLLSLTSILACANLGRNSNRIPANAVDIPSILTAIESKTQEKVTKLKDNQILLAEAGNSRKNPSIQMEDCRKVAIRQAILDASVQGAQNIQLVRRASHRIRGTSGNQITAHVGLALQMSSGTKELTYSYLLDDPSDGSCYIENHNGPHEVLNPRRQVEQTYGQKNVGKLIESECEQNSLNGALFLSSQLYQKKFATTPVMVLDFKRSMAQWSDKNRPTSNGVFQGHWAFVMMDSQGKNLMQAKVGFQLKSTPEDQCAGAIDNFATEFAD